MSINKDVGKLKSFRQVLVKLLPREHGASVIWLSSVIIALLSLRQLPDPNRLLLFIISSTIILVIVAMISRHFLIIVHAERSPILLPFISCILTLITPLGTYLMANHISNRDLSVWLILVTYTGVSVLFARRSVRNIVLDEHRPMTSIVLGGSLLLTSENILLTLSGWIPLITILSILPLPVTWFSIRRLGEDPLLLRAPRMPKIKRIGLLQMGNMLTFALILSFSSRL